MRRPSPPKAAQGMAPAALAAAALLCLPALAQDGRPITVGSSPTGPLAAGSLATGLTVTGPAGAAAAARVDGRGTGFGVGSTTGPFAEEADGPTQGSDRAITGGADLAFGLNSGASDRFETRLDADAEARTSTQFFGLGARGTILGPALSDEANGDGWELADPVASFRYRRDAFDGNFSLRGSVSEDKLSFRTATDPGIDLEDPFLDPSLLLEGDGLRRDLRLAFSLSALEDLPVGVEASGSVRDTDYIGTPENFVSPFTGDPAFLDTRTGAIDAALRLDVTPLLTTRLGVGLSRADTGQDFGSFETRRVFASADYRPAERLALEASLGVAENVRPFSGESETGLTASLGGSYELPRGAIGASYARVFDISGARDEFSVRRDLLLPGGDTLGVEVGLSRPEGGDAEVVGAVDYVRTGRRDEIALSFGRTVRTTVSGGSSTLTTLGAAYRRELTARDGLTVTADYTSVGDADTGRVVIGLDRQITRDWGLSAGVERRIQNGQGDDAVFLTLGRRFQLGD